MWHVKIKIHNSSGLLALFVWVYILISLFWTITLLMRRSLRSKQKQIRSHTGAESQACIPCISLSSDSAEANRPLHLTWRWFKACLTSPASWVCLRVGSLQRVWNESSFPVIYWVLSEEEASRARKKAKRGSCSAWVLASAWFHGESLGHKSHCRVVFNMRQRAGPVFCTLRSVSVSLPTA